jgi:hypothetical protein
MPSSISSSERIAVQQDRYARKTAADRPGIAQPVPVRPVPEQRWGRILLGALALFLLLLGTWEWYWRAFGAKPGVNNSFGLWAIQRRRIDAGEGDATLLVGASRLFFDISLPVWERLDGRRPIQLSLEGTTPLIILEDLAADPKFTGRVLVGVAPDVFFAGFKFRGGVLDYTRKESPSQRIGQWLSMRLIEPYLAFDDFDFALEAVLARQPWPQRPGQHARMRVRKLAETEADRNTHLWAKVEKDPEYRALTRRVWLNHFQHFDDDPTPQEALKIEKEQIERTAKVIARLRARGVKVLLVRLPSSGAYLDYERRYFPRAQTWDALLAATGVPGIHFEDYPELQGYELPEWSHVTRAEGERLTAALYRIIQRDFWGAGATGSAAASKPER